VDGQGAAVAVALVRRVYLKSYADGREARASIGSRIAFYNGRLCPDDEARQRRDGDSGS
jgi:hypothetical protein